MDGGVMDEQIDLAPIREELARFFRQKPVSCRRAKDWKRVDLGLKAQGRLRPPNLRDAIAFAMTAVDWLGGEPPRAWMYDGEAVWVR